MTRSLAEIDNAAALVAAYCNPANGYGWPLYDEDYSVDTFVGADLATPALLSYPVQSKYLNEFGRDGTPYYELYKCLLEFVNTPSNTHFEDLDASAVSSLTSHAVGGDIDGPEDWRAFVRCLDAVQPCDGLTSVAVTKMLHRKRPELVPINDSRLQDFYGVKDGLYGELFKAMHADLQRPESLTLLDEVRSRHRTPGGRPMTRLRALDIIVQRAHASGGVIVTPSQ